ncbi:unnamed protein product [Caenorhabditis bovis]|uniref:RING-CH-type domain-containing protein n=1 Tax=Caenorhabditis bovis TaxID=2654633 RepID=A0A8S1E294_9PELO|nr:unnamed protein product [Caenorhabditis bovis]
MRTTARSSSVESGLSVSSTQVSPSSTPKRVIRHSWLLPSPTISTTSASRRICRICQMDSGDMVRPCDCAGTMGDVHQECLSKWVNMSHKKACEICKSEYAKGGAHFKPLRNWEKPKIEFSSFVGVFILLSVTLLAYYIIDIMNERYFVERIFVKKMYCRPDDSGRIFVLFVLALAALNNIYTIIKEMCNYLRNQRQILFVSKHK